MNITRAIDGLSERIHAYRFVCEVERGRVTMPLEIRGLKASMLKVAQRIERINAKAQAFDAIGADLEQGLDDITAQVKSHGEDMEFAATVLGNSTSESQGAPEVARPGPTVFSQDGAAAETEVSGEAQ